MPERARRRVGWTLAAACAAFAPAAALAAETPGLGRPLSAAELARLETTVWPDGRGLPPGGGSAAEGAPHFARLCARCHGARGEGATADELAGGRAALDSDHPDKNVGNYWPFATTLFDWIRRSMPMDAPGSLDDDTVYALTAYLLYLNGLVDEHQRLDAATLPAVVMPNREGFVPAYTSPHHGDPARLEAALRRAAQAARARAPSSGLDAPWD